MTPDPKPDHLPPLAEAHRVLHQLASTALGMLRANVPPIHKPGPPMLADLLNQAAWEQLSSVRSAVLCYDAELDRLREENAELRAALEEIDQAAEAQKLPEGSHLAAITHWHDARCSLWSIARRALGKADAP